MHIKNLLYTAITLLTCIAQADIYTADVRQALHYILTETDEQTLILCSVDMPNLAHIYTMPHKEIEKQIKTAIKQHKKEATELIATIKTVMQTMNPLYVAVAKISPHVIGFTQRSLRWAHYLSQACEQEEIVNEPKRLAIRIPAANKADGESTTEKPTVEDCIFESSYIEIECNANILYLEDADTCDAIYHYIKAWHPTCTRIILVDTDEATLHARSLRLSELQAPPVTALLVRH